MADAGYEVANGGRRGKKARALGEYAQKVNVELNVVHISGASNPADQYTVTGGAKRWQDNDWNALVTKTRNNHTQLDGQSNGYQAHQSRRSRAKKANAFAAAALLDCQESEEIQAIKDDSKKRETID
jgi:hypothetical protein